MCRWKRESRTYAAGRPESPFNIALFGDVKPRGSKDSFDAEQKGHVIEIAYNVFRAQPFRSEVTCFLSNGHCIQFFKLLNKDNAYSLTESAELVLNGEGGKVLLGLLTSRPVDIGWDVPVVTVAGEAVSLGEVLGQGALQW